jgi:hypothetical protein
MMAEVLNQGIPSIANLIGFNLSKPLWPTLKYIPKSFVDSDGLEFRGYYEIMFSVWAEVFEVESE